jgi:hypothetical protein
LVVGAVGDVEPIIANDSIARRSRPDDLGSSGSEAVR